MDIPNSDKVDALTKHAAEIDERIRVQFHDIRRELETQGLSDHDIDTALLNALCRLMAQTLTHIALLLSLKETPSDEEIDKMLPELMKNIASDVFESAQSILAKHSGRSVLHIVKNVEGGNP